MASLAKRRVLPGAIGGIPEMIMALVIMAMLMVPLTSATFSWLKTQQEIVAVQHILAIREAASTYIRDNWSTVYAWAASPQKLTVSSLVSAGYLSPGYQADNAFGQTHYVLVRQSGTNLLDALVVTTGGVAVEEGRIAGAALRGGADAGYVPYSADPVPCAVASCARGAKRVWEESVSPFAGTGVGAEPGHFAALLHFNGGAVVTDYLYRYQVPGISEANTMHTDILMNSNSVTDALNVTATNNISGGNIITGTKGLLTNLVVTSGAACGTTGLLGRLTDGSPMVCVNGVWASASGSFGGVYTLSVDSVCGTPTVPTCSYPYVSCLAVNPFTGSCSCPSGTTPSVAMGLNSTWPWIGVLQCTNGGHAVTDFVWLGSVSSDGDGTGSGGGGGGTQ